MKRLIKRLYLNLRRLVLEPFACPAISEIDLSSIRSIVVLRFDRVGDMVQTTPMLAALKVEFPQSKVTVLASAINAPILENNPHVDRVVVVSSENPREALNSIRGEEFDLLIDPYWGYDLDWILISRKIPSRYRLGFDIYGRGFSYNIRIPFHAPYLSAVEQILELCRQGLGRPFRHSDPKVYLLKDEKEHGRELLHRAGADMQKPLVLLHPGGYFSQQRWPVERFADVAGKLTQRGRWAVFFTGGKSEEALFRQVANQEVKSIVASSLRDWMAMASYARLLICNNSGPLHIACALKIPTLSTMGPATDRALWMPQGTIHEIVQATTLEKLTVEEILQRALSILEGMAGGSHGAELK